MPYFKTSDYRLQTSEKKAADRRQKSVDHKGFTLVELMVVVSIISILTAIGAVIYSGATRDAKNTKRVQDLLGLSKALEIYKSQHPIPSTSNYPTSVSFQCIETALATALVPRYMVQLPVDPGGNDTGHCYEYSSDGVDYKIRTNRNLPGNNSLNVSDLNKQAAHIDPASYTSFTDCSTHSGQPRGFAVFSPIACSWGATEYVAYASGGGSSTPPPGTTPPATTPPSGTTPPATTPPSGTTPPATTPPATTPPATTPPATTPPSAVAIRINSGDGAYTDTGGNSWLAETYNIGGGSFTTGSPINGTNDDPLYQNTNSSPSAFSYAIPIANGTYTVTLKFAEIVPAAFSVGARRFNVVIEGTTVLSSFDVYVAAGNQGYMAVDRTFSPTVADGTLNINFNVVAGRPSVNAISVISP